MLQPKRTALPELVASCTWQGLSGLAALLTVNSLATELRTSLRKASKCFRHDVHVDFFTQQALTYITIMNYPITRTSTISILKLLSTLESRIHRVHLRLFANGRYAAQCCGRQQTQTRPGHTAGAISCDCLR